MTSIDVLAADFVDAVLRHVREHPEKVLEIQRAFRVGTNNDAPPVIEFMKVAEFAQHIGMCKRSVENMVTEGLPIVGKGRRRRVPVAEAVSWVRAGGADAEIEKRARFDANRASRTVAARKVQE